MRDGAAGVPVLRGTSNVHGYLLWTAQRSIFWPSAPLALLWRPLRLHCSSRKPVLMLVQRTS